MMCITALPQVCVPPDACDVLTWHATTRLRESLENGAEERLT